MLWSNRRSGASPSAGRHWILVGPGCAALRLMAFMKGMESTTVHEAKLVPADRC